VARDERRGARVFFFSFYMRIQGKAGWVPTGKKTFIPTTRLALYELECYTTRRTSLVVWVTRDRTWLCH
jgi:hypothetical protein